MNAQLNFDAEKDDVVTDADIMQWQELKQAVSRLQAQEKALRTRIARHFFADPKEGTNKVDLGAGYQLKMNYKIDRKIDTAMLTVIVPRLAENGVDIETLVEVKPQLRIANYRKLSDSNKLIFDQCLTATPGLPSLEIVPPKEK